MTKFFLLFVLIFSFPVFTGDLILRAQTAETELKPLNFSEETLNEFKENPDFDYSEAAANDNWWTQFKRYVRLQWQRFMEWLFGDYEAPLLLAIFLEILPYLILGFLLLFIFYLFSKLNAGNHIFGTPAQGELHFEGEEKIVRSRDIPKLIEKAVSSGKYRLAVRYHFLYLLQQMSRQEIVSYDSAKTDEEYLQEIKDPSLKTHFKKVNRIYDFIWYGNFETGAEDYVKIKKEFEKAEILIRPQHE